MFWMLPSSRAAGPAAGELVVGPLGRRAVRAPDAALGLPRRASSGQAGSPGQGSAAVPASGATGPTDPASAGSFEYVGWVAGGWPTSGRRPAQVSPGQAAEPGSVGRSGAPGSPSPGAPGWMIWAPDRHGPRPAAGSLCAEASAALGVFQFGTGRSTPSVGPSAAGAAASLAFQAGASGFERGWSGLPVATSHTANTARSPVMAHINLPTSGLLPLAPNSAGVAAAGAWTSGKRRSTGMSQRSCCAVPVKLSAGRRNASVAGSPPCRRAPAVGVGRTCVVEPMNFPRPIRLLRFGLSALALIPRPHRPARGQRGAQWSCTRRTVVTIGSDPAGLESCSGYTGCGTWVNGSGAIRRPTSRDTRPVELKALRSLPIRLQGWDTCRLRLLTSRTPKPT